MYVLGLTVQLYNVFELSLSFLGLDLFAHYITWGKESVGPWLAWVIWDSAGWCLRVGFTPVQSIEHEPYYLH